MRVDVVIVTHQSASHVERAVGELPAHADVVVVDNASTDGTPDLARRVGATTVIENDVNAGFAAAANQGARLGTGDAILFLNPDATIRWTELERLVRGLEARPGVAVVAPRVFHDNGAEQRVWWPFPSSGGAWREAAGLHRRRPDTATDGFVIGACFLVRRCVFDSLGGFDTRYWLYAEETDLCRRAVDAGWGIEIVQGSVAHHAGGASGGATRALVAEHFARGGDRFVMERQGRGHLLSYRCAKLVGATLRSLLPGSRSRRQFQRERALRIARTLASTPTTVALDSPATQASKHTLVVCSLERWDEVWRRNQFLVRGLLARDPNLRVLFAEPPFDWLHRLRVGDSEGRVRQFRSVRADGRVLAYQPGKVLPRVAGPFADRSIRRQVRRAARRLGFERPTLWINDASYAALVAETGWPSVYDITDDWLRASISPRARRRLEKLERALLDASDAVVVCSDDLARTRGTARADLVTIPNAVDTEHFAAPRPRPADLPPAPTAVYVGTLHEDRLDVMLVADLARARPDLHIVLVGPDALPPDSRIRLEHHSNVLILGVRAYGDIPAYYQHADVLIVPHVTTPFTESLDPIKAYECLAVDTPTVATPVAGFRDLGAWVRVVGREQFVAEVGAALVARREVARPSMPSWAERATDFAEVLQSARLDHASTARPLRIVFVDHCAQLSGGELALARLLDAVDNVECHVILGEHGPLEQRLIDAGATVEVLALDTTVQATPRDEVRVGLGSARRLISTGAEIATLRRRLRQLRPDLVHTNSLKAAVYGGIAGRLAGIPVVWHVRDRIARDYLPAQAAILIKILALFVPRAIIFNSQTTRASYGATTRFAVIPSPVVYDAVSAAAQPRSAHLGEPLCYAMLGRLAPWKGQDVFLRAFAAAFPMGHERAVIAGSAMFGEDDYAHALEVLASDLGISDRVEFAGFVDDVTGLLGRVDVLVHASVLPEPFGQVVVEGMAAGLPVIAAAAGGPAEVISDGVNGLLVPPGDVDALACAMKRLAGDAALRHDLGRAARTRAGDFASELVAAATREVWLSVVGDRQTSSAGDDTRIGAGVTGGSLR
jgi:glycosyltransferase involved in cell wall biosynthesis/GT2 family glycosyltransferase